MTLFDDVIPAIAKCEGYTIDRVSMSVIEESDVLEIGFRWGPGKPDRTLSMQNVYCLALGRSPGADLLYVDKITATPLAAGEPGDAPVGHARAADLPALLWIRMEPLHLEVVAGIVTVFEEVL